MKYRKMVAYRGQDVWIQGVTIRGNVCFGKPYNPERYCKAAGDACLDQDLDMLPNEDTTEAGEKVSYSFVFFLSGFEYHLFGS